MCRALQQQFQAKEDATGASPTLSVDALTAAMTKREAARIFYQICGRLPTPVGLRAEIVSPPRLAYVQALLDNFLSVAACMHAIALR